jgi:hypothetical protein
MSKDILLLGEFSTGKSAFLNMLLGVQLLPEQLDSTNLPVVKIHSGKPGGIWLRESGQKNPRAIESWSDIPADWNEFDHAEVTVSGHPYLEKGLTFWDTPGINTTNSHHRQHLDDFLKSNGSSFLRAFYFVSGNLTSTSIEYLKQNRSLWDKMMIIVNIKEVMGERQSRQIETEVKKTVLTQVGNIPVELLYIGDACEEFNELSEKNREGLSDYDLMRKWSELQIDLTGLLEGHEDDVIGTDMFDIILTFADMPELDVEDTHVDESDHSLAQKEDSSERHSATVQKNIRPERETPVGEDIHIIVKGAKSFLKNNRLKQAVELFRKAAELGDAEAQYHLGVCYTDGTGVKHNKTDSSMWIKKAADQGHVAAQYIYAWRIREDNQKGAAKMFQEAADKGHAYAQHELGRCYRYGWGVDANLNLAVKWHTKASNQGLTCAQVALHELR